MIRDIEFLEDIQCSILSERRVFQPYGLNGGESAQSGQNLWVKLPRDSDGDYKEGKENKPRVINLGGKQTVKMGKGDRIIIKTPGGGGWGKKEDGPVQKRTWKGDNSRGSLSERKGMAEGA